MLQQEFKSAFIALNEANNARLLIEMLKFHGYKLRFANDKEIISDCYLYQSNENPYEVCILSSIREENYQKLINDGYVDCGNNIEMLIPIMNMNCRCSKGDAGQWFVYEPTGKMIYNEYSNFNDFFMIMKNNFYAEEGQDIKAEDFHRASIEEIIEYYKSNPLGRQYAYIRIRENMNLENIYQELLKRELKLLKFDYLDECIVIKNGYVSTSKLSIMQYYANNREINQVDAFLDIASINLYNDENQHFVKTIKGQDGFTNDFHCKKRYMMIPNYRKATVKEIEEYYDLPF